MKQREGILFYSEHQDRYDIVFDTGECYDGLHCGECFEVFFNDEWRSTRIEMGRDWFFVSIDSTIDLCGMRVRI